MHWFIYLVILSCNHVSPLRKYKTRLCKILSTTPEVTKLYFIHYIRIHLVITNNTSVFIKHCVITNENIYNYTKI